MGLGKIGEDWFVGAEGGEEGLEGKMYGGIYLIGEVCRWAIVEVWRRVVAVEMSSGGGYNAAKIAHSTCCSSMVRPFEYAMCDVS